MTDKKISQLPNGNIDENSIFPIVTSGVTSQTTFADLVDSLDPFFSGGDGNLQQTLDNGPTAAYAGPAPYNATSSVSILGPDTNLEVPDEYGLKEFDFRTGTPFYGGETRYSQNPLYIELSKDKGQPNTSSSIKISQKRVTFEIAEGNDVHTTYNFPENGTGKGGAQIIATLDDIPTSGIYGSSVTNVGSGVVNLGDTWVQNFVWTKVNNVITCSVEISVEINQDVSSGTWIDFSLPFPQGGDSRTNVGNGLLSGGGWLVPSFVQMSDTNNVKAMFFGKSGDTTSSYQGEVHFAYLTD